MTGTDPGKVEKVFQRGYCKDFESTSPQVKQAAKKQWDELKTEFKVANTRQMMINVSLIAIGVVGVATTIAAFIASGGIAPIIIAVSGFLTALSCLGWMATCSTPLRKRRPCISP